MPKRSLLSLSENTRIVLRDLGLVVQIVWMMALLSLPVALSFREFYALAPLLITAGVSLALGMGLYWGFRRAGETTLRQAMVVAALGWLLVSAIGGLPFYLIARALAAQGEATQTMLYFLNPLHALFESISGYTGTGLTVTFRPSELPRTLQWWRSFAQWIGGVGVIVLMLSIIGSPGSRTFSLYAAEARSERIYPSVYSTVRTIRWIYLLYTLASVLLLRSVGMPLWEAINHAMTGIATGGFTVVDGSIRFYKSLKIELALLPIMVFGAISFAVHYEMLRRHDPRPLARDPQTRWLFLLLMVGSLALAGENLLQLRFEPLTALRAAGFQFFSALTCTGFQTGEVHSWSPTAKLILAGAMVLGGAAGSTAGGVKLIRAIVLIKGVSWRLRRLIALPHVLVRFQIGGHSFTDEEAVQRLVDAALLMTLWSLFLGVGVIVLLHTAPPGYGLSDIIFEVASAQGNVGLSTGITGPTMAPLAEVVLCFNMWIGRLEIIPVLLFLRALLRGLE